MKAQNFRRCAALLLAIITLASLLCACGKKTNAEEDAPLWENPDAGEPLGTGSVSNVEEEDGVNLKIRTSSDYYIDGEQIVLTAVIANNTDGYIPVCSPLGERGREGALELSVTADGYELVCLDTEWGKTMPVSMSDVKAQYYFLLEPSASVTCTYIYDSKAQIVDEVYPLWKSTVNAKLSVQTGEPLEKRQGGLEQLQYTTHEISVDITFDGMAKKPAV